MTDFQTFAINLAIAVLKIQAGQRYGDEHDLLNMITSLREVPSSSNSDSSQRRPVTRDQQTQTNAATSHLGRNVTIRPQRSSNTANVGTSTSRRISIDTSDDNGQDTQDLGNDYDSSNNNNDDEEDEPLVRRRREPSPPERQPTPPLLEYRHESTPQFPNGDVTFSHNYIPGQTPLDTRSVGWAFFVYKTETFRNHKTFRKSCLGIYMCPECKTTERPRIPHTGQHYKHKPPFPPKTICCNGQAPIHIPCMCLLRIDDNGTTCTFTHTGYHNHPKPQTIRPSRAGKRRFAEIIETAPGIGPSDLVSGSTDLPPLAEIDPFYADSEHVAYHRRRVMKAANAAAMSSLETTNLEGGSGATTATAAGMKTSSTTTTTTTTSSSSSSSSSLTSAPTATTTAVASSVHSPSTVSVVLPEGGRSVVALPDGELVSLTGEVMSNVVMAVTAATRASPSAIPSGSSIPSGFSTPSTSSAIPSHFSDPSILSHSSHSLIPSHSSIPTTSTSSSSSTTTDATIRTSTLRANSTEVALDSVSVRGMRPLCLSCGHKIDRSQQRLVFTGADIHKRYKKNESCHVQASCVDALSPELKELAYTYWKQHPSLMRE